MIALCSDICLEKFWINYEVGCLFALYPLSQLRVVIVYWQDGAVIKSTRDTNFKAFSLLIKLAFLQTTFKTLD